MHIQLWIASHHVELGDHRVQALVGDAVAVENHRVGGMQVEGISRGAEGGVAQKESRENELADDGVHALRIPRLRNRYRWLFSLAWTARLNSADLLRGTLRDRQWSLAKCLASNTICPQCIA